MKLEDMNRLIDRDRHYHVAKYEPYQGWNGMWVLHDPDLFKFALEDVAQYHRDGLADQAHHHNNEDGKAVLVCESPSCWSVVDCEGECR